ncbi:DUF3427 domain-containing protein [Priestia megaterium]|uniref:DUF3427 domain-containing protein n=1 Tax=Priestia megaterium TaxID=1404 RepID=UPI001374FFD7|nr:DUF3883 domain-containing protein [Priestia megaterium]
MTKPLQLYETYDRKMVHDIFEPFSPFHWGTGTWGSHGIVKIPNRDKNYVFFVTFGRKQGDHQFKEEITQEGILTWQSQPHQTLKNPNISKFVNHDHTKNNIYLFLRTRSLNPKTKKAEPYTYLGQLAYISHDKTIEKPVHFTWQILNWHIDEQTLRRMSLSLANFERDQVIKDTNSKYNLILVDPPYGKSGGNVNSPSFQGRHINFSENELIKKSIGLSGELLVLENEKQYLIENDRRDLADKVLHTSVIEGDGAGFDIQSYFLDDKPKFIEVKTTVGGINTPFIVTANELAFSKAQPNSYELHRVYNFKLNSKIGYYYILKGDISANKNLIPNRFMAY